MSPLLYQTELTVALVRPGGIEPPTSPERIGVLYQLSDGRRCFVFSIQSIQNVCAGHKAATDGLAGCAADLIFQESEICGRRDRTFTGGLKFRSATGYTIPHKVVPPPGLEPGLAG